MTQCKFAMRDNKLITISGAAEGTYSIVDNYADITVGETTTKVYPFDSNNIVEITNNEITINI